MTDISNPLQNPPAAATAARRRVSSGTVASQPETPAPARGFRATLHDAGLWGLLQLRCESRARSVVRVGSSSGSVGYLYFADGQVVHAMHGSEQGERAALHILGWSEGTWDTCERAWPTQPSITTSWQGLLLRAAQLEDEQKRPNSRPDETPAQGVTTPPRMSAVVTKNATALAAAPRMLEPKTLPALPTQDATPSYRPADFEHAVRMDPRGEVLTGHGAVDAHAALASYACRLADLMGELFGMGPVVALDSTLRPVGRCLIFRDRNSDTVVLRPRANVELSRLKAQLNL